MIQDWYQCGSIAIFIIPNIPWNLYNLIWLLWICSQIKILYGLFAKIVTGESDDVIGYTDLKKPHISFYFIVRSTNWWVIVGNLFIYLFIYLFISNIFNINLWTIVSQIKQVKLLFYNNKSHYINIKHTIWPTKCINVFKNIIVTI